MTEFQTEVEAQQDGTLAGLAHAAQAARAAWAAALREHGLAGASQEQMAWVDATDALVEAVLTQPGVQYSDTGLYGPTVSFTRMISKKALANMKPEELVAVAEHLITEVDRTVAKASAYRPRMQATLMVRYEQAVARVDGASG